MASLSEMTAWRDALAAARFRGVRTVEMGERRITYATDQEMREALRDLDAEIAKASGRRINQIRITSSKGL